MMLTTIGAVLIAVAVSAVTRPGDAVEGPALVQTADDPALRAAVERYFATQEAEDAAAYLALWSRKVDRPKLEQLKYVFDSGDDTFTGITILRAIPSGDRMRARVTARRSRTLSRPSGSPITIDRDMTVSLTYVKEDGDWKLVREGPAADDLAAELLEARTPEARKELLATDADLVGDPLISALSRRGSTAAQVQLYAEAASIFERTLEVAQLTANKKAQGEALQNIANALYFTGKHERALERYTERLALERERADDEAIASSLGGIATIRYTYAEYGPALTAYREALAIQDRLGDTAGAATTLISTGNILYLQGDYEGAIADYRRSRDLNHNIHNTEGEARALEGLGRVFTAQGNYAAALDAFNGVLAEGRARSNRRTQGSALQHIAEIHFRLGNLDVARASYEESRGHYESIGDQPNVGRVWQGLALTDLAAGRFTASEQEYAKSIAACSGADDRDCVAHALVGLAFAQDSQQKFDDAVTSYGKAIAAFTALDKREGAARSEIGLSHALLGKGDLDRAHASARHARDEALALSSDDVLWRALVADARVLRKKQDGAGALAAANDAVAAAERLQRVADERPGNSPVPDAVDAFALLTVLRAGSGDASAAHASAERMRTFALRATLLPNEREIYRGMTPEERAEERASVAQLLALDAQIKRQQSLPKPDTPRIETLTAELADGIARRTEARKRLFDRLPDLRKWRGLVPPAGASEIGNLLSRTPGSIIIQFVVDEDDVVVLTAETSAEDPALAASALPLTRQWLAERIAGLVQPKVLQDAAAWKRSAGEFRMVLLPDAVLARLERARSVLVVPDGALWRFPFEALPLEDRYLGDTPSVSYAGSLAAAVASGNTSPLPHEGQQEGSRLARSLVVVGAPEIAREVRDLAQLTAPGWTLRPTAAVEPEAKRAAAAYGEQGLPASAVVVSGKEATEPTVRAAAAAASVLHIAAPFRINAASPLFSPALLASNPPAPAPGAADDGMLEMREIMNLSLPARVVVLSDGDAAAMRDAQAATGAIAWAWLAAGTPSVVLNRWAAEASAPDLLGEFHRRLLRGDSSADALRAARAGVRARAEWSAPYYWAGWMDVGK